MRRVVVTLLLVAAVIGAAGFATASTPLRTHLRRGRRGRLAAPGLRPRGGDAVTAYPPGLTAHDRAVWDLLMADHRFCTVVSEWSPERQAVVDRCFCGREWWLPRGQARNAVTAIEAPTLELPAGRPCEVAA